MPTRPVHAVSGEEKARDGATVSVKAMLAHAIRTQRLDSRKPVFVKWAGDGSNLTLLDKVKKVILSFSQEVLSIFAGYLSSINMKIGESILCLD